MKIDFLSATNGGITMVSQDTHIHVWSDTAEGLALVLNAVGLDDTLIHSSTMDFASRNGFATNDGAHDLWDRAVALARQGA